MTDKLEIIRNTESLLGSATPYRAIDAVYSGTHVYVRFDLTGTWHGEGHIRFSSINAVSPEFSPKETLKILDEVLEHTGFYRVGEIEFTPTLTWTRYWFRVADRRVKVLESMGD